MFKKAKSAMVKHSGEAMNNEQKDIAEKKQIRIMLIILLVLCGLIYQKVSKYASQQTTVLVPYGAKSSDMLITGESASTGYVRQLARLIVTDYGSVSKASVDNKYAELLGIVHIDRVEAMRVKLNEKAKYFKQFNTVSQSMEIMNDQPMTITENPEGRDYKTDAKIIYRLVLSVEQRKIVGDVAKTPETLKLSIDYTIAEGRFWILDIKG